MGPSDGKGHLFEHKKKPSRHKPDQSISKQGSPNQAIQKFHRIQFRSIQKPELFTKPGLYSPPRPGHVATTT